MRIGEAFLRRSGAILGRFGWLLWTVSCVGGPAGPASVGEPRAIEQGFRLHILKLQWPDLGFTYTAQELWPKLRAVNLAESALVLGESDIRLYDWKNQELWLHDAAALRLNECCGDVIKLEAVGRAFVVTLNGRWLYGGVFYLEQGAAAIRFPVIHQYVVRGSTCLRIRPELGFGCGGAGVPETDERCKGINDPELFKWLSARGKIGHLAPDQRPHEFRVRAPN